MKTKLILNPSAEPPKNCKYVNEGCTRIAFIGVEHEESGGRSVLHYCNNGETKGYAMMTPTELIYAGKFNLSPKSLGEYLKRCPEYTFWEFENAKALLCWALKICE